jgi:hypothetical protein
MASMPHPTLAVAAVVALAAAVVYLHVGRVFLARHRSGDVGNALGMFALWWIATGMNIAIASGFIAAAAFGWTDLDLQVTYAILQRLLLGLSMVGLVHYLLVVVRGHAAVRPLVAFYGAYTVLLLAMLNANQPVGVYVGDWRTDLEYADEDALPPWVTLLSAAWLIVPPVALAIRAIVVARRLPPSQRGQRNRITLVGLAIVAWWVVAVLAGQREAFGAEFFQLFNRFLGLSMALVVLAAYSPPAWMRRYVE